MRNILLGATGFLAAFAFALGAAWSGTLHHDAWWSPVVCLFCVIGGVATVLVCAVHVDWQDKEDV